MADNALKRLARLLGGVALTQGRLPHQVLGQLLITNSSSAEVAGATVVVAATSRVRGAVAQVAVRTAAPAIAVQALVVRQEKRLQRVADRAQARERDLGATLERTRCDRVELDHRRAELERRTSQLDARAVELERQELELRERTAAERGSRAELERDNEALRAELAQLRAELAQLRAATPSRADSPRPGAKKSARRSSSRNPSGGEKP